MYIVTIKNKSNEIIDTLFSDQYGSLKKTLEAAYSIAESVKEDCRVEYRIMGCL